MENIQQSIIAKCDVKHGHDYYWQRIMSADVDGSWKASDIWCPGNGHRRNVKDFIGRLIRAGFAAEVTPLGELSANKFIEKQYRLLVRQANTPRVRRDGTVLKEKYTETIWRTIKMLKIFTYTELAEAASVDDHPLKPTTAMRYIRYLTAVNVITIVSEGAPGVEARFRFLRNLGAAAPQILRTKMVYDPNAHAILGVCIAEEVSS